MSELSDAIEMLEKRLSTARQEIADVETTLRVLRGLVEPDIWTAAAKETGKYKGLVEPPPLSEQINGARKSARERRRANAEALSNGEEATSTRDDILLALKFQERTLDDLAAQAQVSMQLARYHVKKLIDEGKIDQFTRAGQTFYKLNA